MQDQLSAWLPGYIVPAVIHWKEALQLTESGKIDRKTLATLAEELGSAGQDYEPPSTATEEWLGAAWAEVLGSPREKVGRRDIFFELGGTSLTALKLLIATERALSHKDLLAHPTLADQAALLDKRASLSRGSPAT